MKTDSEVYLMLRERKNGKTLEQAAARAGMSVPTARKYLRAAKLPSPNPAARAAAAKHDVTLQAEKVEQILGRAARDRPA